MPSNPLLAPLIGLLGVLIGIVGNSLATSRREQRAFLRGHKLTLYLDLQNEEYELRDSWKKLGMFKSVSPEWSAINARWSSLLLRSSLFASSKVQKLARSYYEAQKNWLRKAQSPAHGAYGPIIDEEALDLEAEKALAIHLELYKEIRRDLGVWEEKRGFGSRALQRSRVLVRSRSRKTAAE